jgi:hypothetical protein
MLKPEAIPSDKRTQNVALIPKHLEQFAMDLRFIRISQ